MAETPPPFQEASRCVVCNCSFTTFRRRVPCSLSTEINTLFLAHKCVAHLVIFMYSIIVDVVAGHCVMNIHQTTWYLPLALPQFGLYSDVRVCSDCLNNSPR
ncbi:hypothetical protein GW17_00012189 [Ensete ventricosum]|nr:hypothetical protein GW17_00012189 [Ensete ventricosum]RZS04721.1 hypothetical protein BHM03_00035130 [Ensete ventricosum]